MWIYYLIILVLAFICIFLLIVVFRNREKRVLSVGNSVLQKIFEAVLYSENYEKTFYSILRSLQNLYTIDYGTVFSYSIDSDIFKIIYSDIPRRDYKELENIVKKIFNEYKDMYTTGRIFKQIAAESFLNYSSGVQRNIKTFILTPLLVNGKLIGALLIENRNNEDSIKDENKFFIYAIRYISYVTRIILREKELFQEAKFDGLTQIHNRAFMEQNLDSILLSLKENSLIGTLVIFDIDHFRNINNTYGHQFGDEVLKDLSQYISKFIRKDDFFCRYGGEEFILLFSDTDKDQTYMKIENLRHSIENLEFKFEEKTITITVSFGIAEFSKTGNNKEALIKCADIALYFSKNSGRNKTTIFVEGMEKNQ